MADTFSHVDDTTLQHGTGDEDSDLHDVVEAMLPLCAHWYDLGLALRIKPSVLDRIKATEPDPRKRLNALMSEWLSKQYNFRKFGNPSWKLLCAAVHSPVGGNNPALAEKIANNHLAGQEVRRDTFKSERSGGGNTTQLKDIGNATMPRGAPEGPLHKAETDRGGSRGGTSPPEKNPHCSEARAAFQQSQENKPNNRLNSTMLSPVLVSLDSEPSLPHLMDKVAAVIPHRYEIVGLQLDLTLAELQVIRPQHQDLEGYHRAFGKVFDAWRRRGSPPYSWRTLIGVLRSASVGEVRLSEQLTSWITHSGDQPVVAEPNGIVPRAETEKCSIGTLPQSTHEENQKKGKNGSIAKSGGQGDNVIMESRSEESDTVASLQHPLQKQLEEKTGTQSSTVLKGTAIPERSKSDSNMQTVLDGSKKSADNGSVKKKQTNVVPTEGSNETDLHDNHYQSKESSSSILSAGTSISEESSESDTCGELDVRHSDRVATDNGSKNKKKQSPHRIPTEDSNGKNTSQQPMQVQVNYINITSNTVLPQADRFDQGTSQQEREQGVDDSVLEQVKTGVSKEIVVAVFIKYFDDLSEGLSPVDITTDLFSNGVISQLDLEEIQVDGQTNKEKATRLLRAVKRSIKIDHTKVCIFLKVLSKHRNYKTLVEKMIADLINGPSGSSTTTTSSIPPNKVENDDSQKLYTDAMKDGYVERKVIKCLIVGAAGVGKTSIKHLILNEKLPKQRETTGVMENPAVAVSLRPVGISRANVKEDGTWHVVHSNEELITMIAEIIKTGVLKRNSQEKSRTTNTFPEAVVNQNQVNLVQDDLMAVNSAETLEPESTAENHGDPISNVLIRAIDEAKGGEKFETKWIHFIDSGGQPEFHNLLPVFVPDTSVVIFVFKLSEGLDEKPIVEYYGPTGRIGHPYKSSLTHREILEHCLQVFRVQSGNCPTILLIGTHKDREHKLQIKELDECLKYQKKVVRFGDCLSDEIEDGNVVKEVRKKILGVIDQVKSEETPIPWFGLELALKKACQSEKLKIKGILSLDRCKQEADAFEYFKTNSGQFEEALKHLVKHNVFIYYPDVLPHVVFCDPQVLLSMVTEIVKFHYWLKSSTYAGIDETIFPFVDNGCISADILKYIASENSDKVKLLPPNQFLKLLSHLKIISAVDIKIGSNVLYLMPALLPNADYLAATIDKEHYDPLHIRFDGGCTPSGMFCSLVTTLLQSEHWKLCQKNNKPSCCFRNCVTFRYKKLTIITLVDVFSHFSIYIHIQKCLTIQKGFPLVIRNEVHESILAVATCLQYSNINFQDAITCPLQNDASSSHPKHNHVALWQQPETSDDKEYFECTLDDSCIGPIPDKYQVWMEKTEKLGLQPPIQQSSVCPSVDTSVSASVYLLSGNSDVKGIIRDADIARIAGDLPQWQLVAFNLGMGKMDIEAIETDYKEPKAQRESFLRKWIWKNGNAATYEKLCKVLETLGEKGAAERIRPIA